MIIYNITIILREMRRILPLLLLFITALPLVAQTDEEYNTLIIELNDGSRQVVPLSKISCLLFENTPDEQLYEFVGTWPQSALFPVRTFCNGQLNSQLKYLDSNSYSSRSNMGTHFLNCEKATDEQKEWLRNPDTYPAKVEGFTRWVRKRVVLYPFEKPMPADCNQHSIGDCNTVSTLADIAYLYPDFIMSLITKVDNYNYIIKMFDPDGKRIEVGVNNYVLCDNNSSVVQMTGKNGVVTWATLLEKAIAKWLYVYKPNTGLGGFGAEGMTPMFTGDGRSVAISPGKCSAQELALVVTTCLKHGLIVNGGFNKQGIKIGSHETITAHGHSLLMPNTEIEPNALFAMRNPWGQGKDDHVMQIVEGEVPPTIDIRIISPGIASLYFRHTLEDPIGPYIVPKW